jgi:uncharacterized protein (DUF4415 family)
MNNKYSPEVEANLRALAAMGDDGIDTGDNPTITDFSNFRRVDWKKGAPPRAVALDPDLLEWFRTHGREGEAVQDTINRVLREHVARAAA